MRGLIVKSLNLHELRWWRLKLCPNCYFQIWLGIFDQKKKKKLTRYTTHICRYCSLKFKNAFFDRRNVHLAYKYVHGVIFRSEHLHTRILTWAEPSALHMSLLLWGISGQNTRMRSVRSVLTWKLLMRMYLVLYIVAWFE